MNQFIFVVDIPKDENSVPPSNESSAWRRFEFDADKHQSPSLKKSRKARNVWLFGCENALPDLLSLSGLAEKHGLAYKAFLVSGEVTPLHGKTGSAAVIGPLKI